MIYNSTTPISRIGRNRVYCRHGFFLGRGIILTCMNSMAEDVAEATESLPKEAGLVGLDGPLDQLDLTKMLAESFEPER
jgi:hypothetical protein